MAETTQGEREKKTNTTKEEKVEGPRVELFILSINPPMGKKEKRKRESHRKSSLAECPKGKRERRGKKKTTGKVHWPSAMGTEKGNFSVTSFFCTLGPAGVLLPLYREL